MGTIAPSKILPSAPRSSISPKTAAGLRRDWPGRNRRLPWVFAIVLLWIERAEQRQALAALEDRQLCDIGISRTKARAEAAKPFWRA